MAGTTKPGSLKVGLVLDDGLDSPDGVQQYILAVGEWLRSQGHEVRYLVGETIRTDIEGVYSLSRNIKVSSNGNTLTIPLLASRRRLKAVLTQENFDVLHIQVPYSPMMGERLVRLAAPNTAVVGTFHILPHSRLIGFGTYCLGFWCRLFSLRRFDAMLSVSSVAADFAKRTFKVSSTVLPNVVDYRRFNQAKPLSKYGDDTLTILFLGRLVPRKGCQLLVAAMKELQQAKTELPKYRVVICGRGPLGDQLKEYVQSNGLSNIVEFAGFVSEADKPRYYASADIAVFPSNGGESFGIVLLEAMASGRAAVLAGDNPGYRSVLEPKAKELLFDPSDTQALASKLQHYLTNQADHQEMAEWGMRYTQGFDTAAVGKKLLTVYAQALHKRGQL